MNRFLQFCGVIALVLMAVSCGGNSTLDNTVASGRSKEALPPVTRLIPRYGKMLSAKMLGSICLGYSHQRVAGEVRGRSAGEIGTALLAEAHAVRDEDVAMDPTLSRSELSTILKGTEIGDFCRKR